MMRGRESEQGFRRRCALMRFGRLSVSRNPAMEARRMAGLRLRSRMPSQVGARQALNLYGKRIWFSKPVQFKGQKWRAACATVQRSIELAEARAWLAVAGRWVVEGWI